MSATRELARIVYNRASKSFFTLSKLLMKV